MDEAEASRYWCHMCSQTVSPIMEVESIKCPICQGGFVEEMASAVADSGTTDDDPFDFGASDPDRAVSLWAPILLGMMRNPNNLRRFRSLGLEENDEDRVSDMSSNERINQHQHHHHGLGMNLDGIETDRGDTRVSRWIQNIAEDGELDPPPLNISRNRSTNVLQFLHGIRAAIQSGNGNLEDGQRGGMDRGRREGERVILINPFNQTIVIQGSSDPNGNSQNVPIGSLGDYFVGPGLDMLLQHLSENDPNRYGTPPAMKDSVEALPDVKIEGTFQCSVCLDDFEDGCLAKEMPCKHKFHSGCILPWLELHSSCPVCRYQLPSDESKINPESSRNNSSTSINDEGDESRREEGDNEGRNENGRRFAIPLPWPFSSLFTSSGSQSSEANSASSSPGTSTNVPPRTSHAHDD
ncbi:ubiquitin-protein ligase [Lithospermum erythrorhizon]|uniref:RING-type E3 ubiquitin transferase n=1 Tax=Lithospermum erythrorhizon TaxID=34254 RepID=A0AAV3NIP1_LITER